MLSNALLREENGTSTMELIKARTLDASNGIHAEWRLGVKFVFYVNHQALLYLVNKAVLSGRNMYMVLAIERLRFFHCDETSTK